MAGLALAMGDERFWQLNASALVDQQNARITGSAAIGIAQGAVEVCSYKISVENAALLRDAALQQEAQKGASPTDTAAPPMGDPIGMLVHAWCWRYGRRGRRSGSGVRSRPLDRLRGGWTIAKG